MLKSEFLIKFHQLSLLQSAHDPKGCLNTIGISFVCQTIHSSEHRNTKHVYMRCSSNIDNGMIIRNVMCPILIGVLCSLSYSVLN